nr:unnamed protein product [Digitaria exilis]
MMARAGRSGPVTVPSRPSASQPLPDREFGIRRTKRARPARLQFGWSRSDPPRGPRRDATNKKMGEPRCPRNERRSVDPSPLTRGPCPGVAVARRPPTYQRGRPDQFQSLRHGACSSLQPQRVSSPFLPSASAES